MTSALERGPRAARGRWIGLRTHPGVFPAADLETPFLNGVVLARRDVFAAINYDESLGGNAWREETSMFLTATERGFRCVLTPRTAVFQLGQWDGGQRRARLDYEAWAIRNNWRFLRTHAATLRRMGEIRSPATEQARFVAERAWAVLRGWTEARWRAYTDPGPPREMLVIRHGCRPPDSVTNCARIACITRHGPTNPRGVTSYAPSPRAINQLARGARRF